MLKWFIFPLVLLLSSCYEKPHGYTYYLLHPEALRPLYKRCGNLSQDAFRSDKDCMAGFDASDKVQALIKEFVEQRAEFGSKLLHAQMNLFMLKQKLGHSEAENNNVQRLRLEIDSRLAIVRFAFTHMRKR